MDEEPKLEVTADKQLDASYSIELAPDRPSNSEAVHSAAGTTSEERLPDGFIEGKDL